jgi:hypothetical protein
MLFGVALGLFLAAPFARAQDDGVEAQARGPIHEAYANPVEGQPAPLPPITQEPPAPIEEVPADQKPQGDNIQWIPGYWGWDDSRNDFLWVSGFWRSPPPGRRWMAGSWHQAATGWQWTPGFWAPVETTEVSYLPPPPAPLEAGPSVPAPTADYLYVPGSWVYVDTHYVWRPGTWILHRPGWVWVPSHYRWTPAGYIFVPGYWDYPLADRGLLFAPVWIDRRYAYRPRWYFSPTIAVYDDALYGALFVRGGGYYYGDYFDVRYKTLGYHSWFSVSFGRSYAYDPLFSYYSFSHRHDPYWAPAMREIYVARYNGDMPRPPVRVGVSISFTFGNAAAAARYSNLSRSTTIVNVTNVHTTVVNIKNVTNVTQNGATMQKFTKLQPVSSAQKAQFIEHSKEIRETAQKRVVSEKHLVTQSGALKANDAPRSLKLDAAKSQISSQTTNKSGPPPAVIHQPTIPGSSNNGKPPFTPPNGSRPSTTIPNKPLLPMGQTGGKNDPKSDKDKKKDHDHQPH